MQAPHDRTAKRVAAVAVLAVFILSVVIRLPNLGRSMGADLEFISAQTLIVQEGWEERGAFASRFRQILTLPDDRNRYVQQVWGVEKDGVVHHISYPPLSVILPYATFKIVGVEPSLKALRIFGLFTHLVVIVLLWQLLRFLMRGSPLWRREGLAVAATSVYALAPMPLWAHSNLYYTDVALMPFFLTGVYSLARISAEERVRARWIVILTFSVLALVLTEWFGVFFAGAAALYLVSRRRRVGGLRAAGLVLGASILGLGLFVWQVSTISGVGPAYDALVNKFQERTGSIGRPFEPNSTILSPRAWTNLVTHYGRGFTGCAVLILVLVIGLLLVRRRRVRETLEASSKSGWAVVAWMTVVPIALHHLVLFNWTTVHSFSTLKSGVVISLAAGWMSMLILEEVADPSRTVASKTVLVGALFVGAALVSVYSYRRQYNDIRPPHQEIARTVVENIGVDEVPFLLGMDFDETDPVTGYLAGRNIAPWEDMASAQRILALNGARSGVRFTATWNGGVVDITRFDRRD